jgi:hypothetical protein
MRQVELGNTAFSSGNFRGSNLGEHYPWARDSSDGLCDGRVGFNRLVAS